jgi:hypothetical protein
LSVERLDRAPKRSSLGRDFSGSQSILNAADRQSIGKFAR